MGKYNITYRCGHEDEITLYGKMDERDKTIEWKKTQLCPACFREEQNKKAVVVLKEWNAPELTQGTDPQKQWANRIRMEFLTGKGYFSISFISSQTYVSDRLREKKLDPKDPEMLKWAKQYTLEKQLSAVWWINASKYYENQKNGLIEWVNNI